LAQKCQNWANCCWCCGFIPPKLGHSILIKNVSKNHPSTTDPQIKIKTKKLMSGLWTVNLTRAKSERIKGHLGFIISRQPYSLWPNNPIHAFIILASTPSISNLHFIFLTVSIRFYPYLDIYLFIMRWDR
jgi:hypothetical protein